MTSLRSSRSLRSLGLVAGFLASLLVMASSNPQCARTSDSVFSPQFSAANGTAPGQCFSACAKAAAEARAAEKDRFTAAIQDCTAGTDCRAREAALHVSIMKEITETLRECMSGCHNQGGGTGGQ